MSKGVVEAREAVKEETWETDWLLPNYEDDDDIIVEANGLDLDARLNRVDYRSLIENYEPSPFAIEFVNFIKLVNGQEGEENESPIIHFDMLDAAQEDDEDLFVAARGTAKTSALHEYMILYLAVFGEFPKFGTVDVGMYISDTMENGVKSMRTNLEFRFTNSEFMMKYVPEAKFTDVRWEFQNADKKNLCFRGFGASTGVRGFKEYGKRPTWCGLDDLMSDKNAESKTITRDIRHIIYKASRQALHPQKRKIIWTGTPFNKSDPLYEAASSGAWNTRVYPICEKFPVPKSDFVGAWEDRFPYEFVRKEYDKLMASGEIASFNQELMLRITSDEDRLVDDSDYVWYNREKVFENRTRYNFYITSDLGVSDGDSNDYSVIIVWAYSNNGDWLLVDGMCERQLMDKNMTALFNYASVYRPLEVGIEINGQQKGFIQWIQNEMIAKNIFFNLAKQKGKKDPGIHRTGKKIKNFQLAVPLFKAKKIWLPRELKQEKLVVELLEEVRFATKAEFKSKNDDVADNISMLVELDPIKPSAIAEPEYIDDVDGQFAWFQEDDDDIYKNSTVF